MRADQRVGRRCSCTHCLSSASFCSAESPSLLCGCTPARFVMFRAGILDVGCCEHLLISAWPGEGERKNISKFTNDHAARRFQPWSCCSLGQPNRVTFEFAVQNKGVVRFPAQCAMEHFASPPLHAYLRPHVPHSGHPIRCRDGGHSVKLVWYRSRVRRRRGGRMSGRLGPLSPLPSLCVA